jgi:uncharacterized membrane protein
MEPWVRATRRGGVILVGVISVVVSLALVSMVINHGAVSRLPTLQLLGLVMLLVLPVVTLGLLRLDQVTAREQGPR